MRWGHWQLNGMALEYLEDGHWRYEVDLERCRTSAQILDWLCQLAEKTWITSADLGDLVRALNHLGGHLQSSMCGCGKENGPVDWKGLLAKAKKN